MIKGKQGFIQGGGGETGPKSSFPPPPKNFEIDRVNEKRFKSA